MLETDYLVVGSGLAGLYFALRASEHGRVLVATKRAPADANTSWAQGGVAGVLDPEDRVESHVEDTLRVGDGLGHRDIVEICAREGLEHILKLASDLGVPFDRDAAGHFVLGREGGHSARRIVHVKDSTGWAIQQALLARVAERADRITILPDHFAIDLLTTAKYGGPNAVFGAYLLDQATGEVKTAVARATVLATGGCGKVYLYTTNPDVATGDGVAMAYRVGARVANMEFYQFHPTVLYHPAAKSFLISEALRGEGGILRLRDGTAFMGQYHEMKDLAPRDVVSRAIDSELKRTGDDHVVLDMTHLPADFLVERFPNIFKRCLALGIDMRTQPIPVVPAAHYSCGGVAVDERGRSTVRNLYAIGEVSMTGLHGACRLASNSLLEAMVFAARHQRVARETGVVLGMVEVEVQPPALGPAARAADDEVGDQRDVAQLDEVAVDGDVPVVVADLGSDELDAVGGALEPAIAPDDADVVPHQAADLVPVVADDDRLVRRAGLARVPGGHLGGAGAAGVAHAVGGARREHHGLQE